MKLLHTTLCAAMALAPMALQDPEAQPRGGERVIEYYRPKAAPAHELRSAMASIYSNVSRDPAFSTFGETLVLEGTAEQLPEARALLERFDQEWAATGGGREAQLKKLEYRTRAVPPQALMAALGPYSRTIATRNEMGKTSEAPNIVLVQERGLIVARGTAEELAEIEAVLKSVDVPQPQVQVSCYLLQGSTEATQDPRVPKPLAQDLSAIVPYAGFELLSFGLFRSDALAPIQLEESLPGGGEFALDLYPRSFDAEGGTITFERCRFRLLRRADGEMAGQTFTTSARVELGESVVLGALGSDPVFVVLKVTRVGG